MKLALLQKLLSNNYFMKFFIKICKFSIKILVCITQSNRNLFWCFSEKYIMGCKIRKTVYLKLNNIDELLPFGNATLNVFLEFINSENFSKYSFLC